MNIYRYANMEVRKKTKHWQEKKNVEEQYKKTRAVVFGQRFFLRYYCTSSITTYTSNVFVSFFNESTQYNFWSFTDHHTLFNFDVQCEKESQINDSQWIGQENRKNIYEGNKKNKFFRNKWVVHI
jgi:hypothetical protein